MIFQHNCNNIKESKSNRIHTANYFLFNSSNVEIRLQSSTPPDIACPAMEASSQRVRIPETDWHALDAEGLKHL